MSTTCYVYALIDPVDEKVGYVGVTCHLRTRYLEHLRIADRGAYLHFPRRQWIEALKRQNLPPLLKILERTTKDDRLARERCWVLNTLRDGAFNDYFKRWVEEFYFAHDRRAVSEFAAASERV
jgi:hypothetical protein